MTKVSHRSKWLPLVWTLAAPLGWAQAPVGETKGSALEHTAASSQAVMERAAVVLPAKATGTGVFTGLWKDAPTTLRERVPVVVFMHGSSGLGLKAIGEWQQWLAEQGIASVAPDSFALPDRLTYKSPISPQCQSVKS